MNRLILGIAVSLALRAQAPNRAEVQLQAAINKETVEGDLEAAIDMYRKVAADHRTNRGAASRALLRLAEAQEKLGETEARKAYEQIVRDYADQQPAAIARARLAALGKSAPAITTRRIVTTVPEWWTGVPNPASPDGRYLFNSLRDGEAWSPAILDLTTGQQRSLPKPEGKRFIDSGVISADNRLVAFTGQPSPNMLDLIVSDFDGANPRTILRTSTGGLRWFYPIGITPDKKFVVLRYSNERSRDSYHLGRVKIATGSISTTREFTTGRLGRAHLSPDGKWIAYSWQARADNPNGDIWVISTDGSSESVLVEHAADDSDPIWSPDGKRVFFFTNRRGAYDLWSVAVAAGRPASEPNLVKNDVGKAVFLGMTPAGSLVMRASAGTVTFQHSTMDEATGKFRPFRPLEEAFSGTKMWPKLSPDEKQIAYIRMPDYASGKAVIGIRDLATGKERELYPNLLRMQQVLWMPGQRQFLVSGRGQNNAGEFLVDAATGQTTPIPESGTQGEYRRGGGGGAVSPDGKTLYIPFYKTNSGAIFAKDLATGALRLVVEANGFANYPLVSPDGRWLFFLDNGETRKVARILSLADATIRDLPEGISVQGWARDSNSVYVLSLKDSIRMVNGKQMLTLFRMPREGGPLTPVMDPIDGSHADAENIQGNSIVYRDNRRHYEILALDNVLSAAK